MEKESEPKKKGSLAGCLLVSFIMLLLLAGMVVFGYLNRYTILPFVTDKLGVEISSVLDHVGTKAETGMPPGFWTRPIGLICRSVRKHSGSPLLMG